jgi:hypothetical protein
VILNVTNWTPTEIDIGAGPTSNGGPTTNGFGGNLTSLFGNYYTFGPNDTLQIQVQNPNDPAAGTATGTVTLPAFLQIFIQPPQSMEVNDIPETSPIVLFFDVDEDTKLLTDILTYLTNQNLYTKYGGHISQVVTQTGVENSGHALISNFDFAYGLVFETPGDIADFLEAGAEATTTELSIQLGTGFSDPVPDPLSIANDAVNQTLNTVYASSDYVIQAELLSVPPLWTLVNGATGQREQVVFFLNLNETMLIRIPLSALPTSGTSLNLTNILLNERFGYYSTGYGALPQLFGSLNTIAETTFSSLPQYFSLNNVFDAEVVDMWGNATGIPVSVPQAGSVVGAPNINVQPQSQTMATGSTAVLTVGSNGVISSDSLSAVARVGSIDSTSYQWYMNGVAVSGATNSTLVLQNLSAANAGNYNCLVSNSVGATLSSTAMLTVISTPNPGRIINISCRAQVGTGGNILIAGFVIGGAAGSEPVLIRGSGPALIPFGVTGTLPDPQLSLYSGSTILGTNNGWGGSSTISNEASTVGAFIWTNPSSHDSALFETLPSGAYTAQIVGQSGDTGVALIELYDATPAGTYTTASPSLVNISTRVQVGTGSDILIAGFVIGGSTSETVLIRASGPALMPFGVTSTLPDPQLTLSSGSTVLSSNTGWGANPQIAAAAASVGAFSWGTSATSDSAMLVTLPPGAYTAQVAGASGDTGVALIEVYEVP